MGEEVLELMAGRELEMLRLINSVSFDFTFLYDCDSNIASVTRYLDGVMLQPETVSRFSDYLLSKVHPDDFTILEKEIKRAYQGAPEINFEIRLKESGGRRFRWHSIHMSIFKEADKNIYAGSSSFVDTRKNRESELTIKARQDPLTGLLNKVVTQENIEHYIKKNAETQCAMIVIDIDNFKNFNDCMGHLFGDEVIKATANSIRKIFGGDSFVGRIGGDEFLVFIKGLTDIVDIVKRMGELRDLLLNIKLGQRSNFGITTSVGISIYPDMGNSFDELFKAADMALYSIKNNGRNSYAFYTEDLYDEKFMQDRTDENRDRSFENQTPYSLTDFAFHLLNESENISSAINLLLYRIRNEYDLEAIHVNEFDVTSMSTLVTYENFSDDRPSYIGRKTEFSFKAWKKYEEDAIKNGGYLLFDFSSPFAVAPGNGVENWPGVQSMVQIPLFLFNKNRGCVDLISKSSHIFWTKKRINEIMSVCNLLSVCLYYSGKVMRAEKQALSKVNDFDTLTGLMKEDYFIETATKIISKKGDDAKLAVVYCDVSNFKYINEAYGYATGDRILCDVADYISHRIPGVVCTGRFYSDNILCIAEFAKKTEDSTLVSHVEAVNETMSSYLSGKYHINNISVRAGVYIIPDSRTDVLQSVSNANMARKLAKSGKGTRCIVFNQEMFEKRKRQIQYIQRLDEAIANEEFYVVLQPKVSGSTNRLVGAEALARWKTLDGTTIYPDEFVPAFEKDGSIVKLDFYVYEKVMAYIRDRLDKGKKIVPISMNVSRAHILTDDFVPKFKALIEKYQVPTQFIELELTESIYLENLTTFNEMIEELRILGIRISMDDFGSGYSSLNALNDLKIDLLKIDKIFMRDDNLKESDKTIIRFIIDMAKTLSMKVVCEGVETEAQRSFLNEAGCDIHQGYLYSKPVEIASFNEFIDNEDVLFSRVG